MEPLAGRTRPMWGRGLAGTSCRNARWSAFWTLFVSLPASRGGMNSAYRRIELPGHVAEIGAERSPPPDQHVIVARAERRGGRKPHHFAEPPAHAVAFHGIADLARDGKAHPDGGVCSVLVAHFRGTLPRLQDKGSGGRSGALCGGLKVRAALQPFHGDDFGFRPAGSHCDAIEPLGFGMSFSQNRFPLLRDILQNRRQNEN
jgi:hypothetical protein